MQATETIVARANYQGSREYTFTLGRHAGAYCILCDGEHWPGSRGATEEMALEQFVSRESDDHRVRWEDPRAVAMVERARAERAAAEARRDAERAAVERAARAATERRDEWHAALGGAKFSRATFAPDSCAGGPVHGLALDGLIVHKRIGPYSGGEWSVSHQASGMSVLPRVYSQREAKAAALRLLSMADWTVAADVLGANRELGLSVVAMRRDPWCPITVEA